jgi:hypothetical protein
VQHRFTALGRPLRRLAIAEIAVDRLDVALERVTFVAGVAREKPNRVPLAEQPPNGVRADDARAPGY